MERQDPNAVVKSTTLQPDVQESAIDICKAAMRNEASPKVNYSTRSPLCPRAQKPLPFLRDTFSPSRTTEKQNLVQSCSLVLPRSHAASRPPRNAPTISHPSPFLFDEHAARALCLALL
jgi:hypothetical protein